MKRILLTFLSFLIPFNSLYAQTKVSSLSEEDQLIYFQVHSMCKGASIRGYEERSSLWTQSVLTSSLIGHTIQGVGNAVKGRDQNFDQILKTSPQFQNMVSSSGFFLALNTCFGDDRLHKDLFFISLLSLDISGKFTSWILDVSLIPLLRATYQGLRAAMIAGGTQIPQRLFRFRTFYGLAMKEQRYYRFDIFKVLVPMLATGIVGDMLADYHHRRDLEAIMTGQTPEKKQILLDEIAHFEELKKTTTSASERADLDLFIRQDREILSDFQN